MTALTSTIEELVQQEVTKRISDTEKDLVTTKQQLTNANRRVRTLEEQTEKLGDIAARVEYIDKMRNMIKIDNIDGFFTMLGFESYGLEASRSSFSRSAKWFEILCNFYAHKKEVLNLFDFFDIKYEKWAHHFKLPCDYSEEQCLAVIKGWSKLDFRTDINDLEYFHDSAVEHAGDPIKMVSGRGFRSSMALPLFFKNTHLLGEKCFSEIIQTLKNKKGSYAYLYALSKYQVLTEDQASEMMANMGELKYLDNYQKDFIKKYVKSALELKPQCARNFERAMSESTEQRESWSHFTNFPLAMQMKYFEKHHKREDQLRILSQMTMDRDQKIEIIIKNNLV